MSENLTAIAADGDHDLVVGVMNFDDLRLPGSLVAKWAVTRVIFLIRAAWHH